MKTKINRVVLPTYGWNWKVYWENPGKTANRSPFSIYRKYRYTKTKCRQQQNPIEQQPKATRETLLAYMQMRSRKSVRTGSRAKSGHPHKTYREQGFDSMMSGEFLTLMEKHIGSELKMDVIHQYNTPERTASLLDRYAYFGGGEVDTTQAVTMADIMFNQEMEHSPTTGDWHEIQPEDGLLLRWFKN